MTSGPLTGRRDNGPAAPGQERFTVKCDDIDVGEIWVFEGRPMWIQDYAAAHVWPEGFSMAQAAAEIKGTTECKVVVFSRPCRVKGL